MEDTCLLEDTTGKVKLSEYTAYTCYCLLLIDVGKSNCFTYLSQPRFHPEVGRELQDVIAPIGKLIF